MTNSELTPDGRYGRLAGADEDSKVQTYGVRREESAGKQAAVYTWRPAHLTFYSRSLRFPLIELTACRDRIGNQNWVQHHCATGAVSPRGLPSLPGRKKGIRVRVLTGAGNGDPPVSNSHQREKVCQTPQWHHEGLSVSIRGADPAAFTYSTRDLHGIDFHGRPRVAEVRIMGKSLLWG